MTNDQNDIGPDSAKPQGAGASVGAGLREVRERLTWKLADIAARLHIREAFLAAIESGDLSSLPGPAYRAGFVRAYAQALGLDGDEILQRFRDAGEMGVVVRPELQLLEPVPDRAVPTSTIIFICLLAIIAGYGLWYYHTEHLRKLAERVPHVPAQLQPLTAPPKVEQAPIAAPARVATMPAPHTTPGPAAFKTPAPSPSATIVSPASTPMSDATAPALTPPATAPASAVKAAPVPGAGMVITATQESWIQVTTSNGTILFSKVLNPGQSWPVPQMPGLKMTTGNAGGTVISTNGVAGQPLGAAGVVLRNYQLTPPASSPKAPATTSPATPLTSTTPPPAASPSSPSAPTAP